VTTSKGHHSKYPCALVGPDGEIYFRARPDAAPEAPATASPPVSTDQPDNRKDSQQ
jgi:hypothetical protein